MFVKVKNYEQVEGFLGHKYQEGIDVWINTDAITGFHEIDGMYIVYSPLPFGKTFISKQDCERIREHLSIDE